MSVVFSGTQDYFNNKTDCHDIIEIKLKVALNIITINQVKISPKSHKKLLQVI